MTSVEVELTTRPAETGSHVGAPELHLDPEVVAALQDLGPEATSGLREFAEAMADLRGSGVSDPSLRQVIHQLFVRSVNEFFTVKRSSMQLPPALLRTFRASAAPDVVRLEDEEPDREPTLDDVLRARRSVRSYDKAPMPLETLATVLRAALGRNGQEDGYGVRDLPLFPYPSMGGLSAFEVGVVAQRVEGLAPGYYVYDQIGHALVPKIHGDLRLAVQDVTFESEWLLYAPVVIVLVGRAPKWEWKYHSRGYRIVHLDMGAAMQNIYLSGWASKVGVCAVAGFIDEAANTLLGYDGVDEFVSLFFGVGAPATPTMARS